jgi:hypothetical protein
MSFSFDCYRNATRGVFVRISVVANENLTSVVAVFKFFHVRICNRFEKKPISFQPNYNSRVFFVAVERLCISPGDNLS